MKRTIVVVSLLGALISVLMVVRLLAPNDFDPSTTIKFGEDSEEYRQYGADLLGNVVIAPLAGHDGKFFFTQAMDPFYLHPDVHAEHLDRPTYRAQRMVYPTLASLGGVLPAPATAWGLILVNVMAMTIGTAYTGLTAVRMGLSPWFGLAFVLNPGMMVDLGIDGAGVVAMAAMMAGVYYMLREAVWPATIALSIASLARETMLIAVVGLAAFYWYRYRRILWPSTIPFLAVGAWWAYVHWRLADGLSQDTRALSLPFVGFFEAFENWLDLGSTGVVSLAVGCVLLLVSAIVLIRSIKTPTALGWAVSGFAVLGVLMSAQVWEKWFDSTRALAPVLTAYVLLGATFAWTDGKSMPAPDKIASQT